MKLDQKDMLVMSAGDIPLFDSSARDLADLLKGVGFNATHVKLGCDWREPMEQAIRTEKPYMAVLVNFTRLNFEAALKKVPVVVTWRQDHATSTDSTTIGRRFNHRCRNDWVIGYTSDIAQYGYNPRKLINTPFFVRKDTCPDTNAWARPTDMFLASCKGAPYMALADMLLYQPESPFLKLFSPFMMLELGRKLSLHYEAGGRMLTFEALDAFVASIGGAMAEAYAAVKDAPSFKIVAYWYIAESIYRQTVVRWFKEANVDIHVAGDGWKDNYAFADLAMPYMPRGSLQGWYNKAKVSLHVNGMSSYHYRIVEILLGGGKPLAHGLVDSDPAPFDTEQFVATQNKILLDVFEGILSYTPTVDPMDMAYVTNIAKYATIRRDKDSLVKAAKDMITA